MIEEGNDGMRNVCGMCRMNNGMRRNACSVCGGMYQYMLLRVILCLGVLAFVFWAGVQVGGMVNGAGDYGYGGYDEYYYGGPGGGRHGGMMYQVDPYPGGYVTGGQMMTVPESGTVPTSGKKVVPIN